MKRNFFLVILVLSMLSMCGSTNAPRGIELTHYIDKSIENMAKKHESAFISACWVKADSSDYTVRVVYFPRTNSGIFTYSTKDEIVLSSGDVYWDPDGQWELSDLEGGMDTIMIMSNISSVRHVSQ